MIPKNKLYNQMRDGISPSRVWLPKGVWQTILDFLADHFKQIPYDYWQQRIEQGMVLWGDGTPVSIDSVYQPLQYLLYYREVPQELPIPFNIATIYEDDILLVVDKPHFLPTNPAGKYVRETALSRLKQQTGNTHLTPLHRLDKDTAGVLLFCKQPQYRAAYHQLFSLHQIEKTYHAIVHLKNTIPQQFSYQSRITKGSPFCIMQEINGMANTQTQFNLIQHYANGLGLLELKPKTGQQHQLRVHCNALNMPIVNDRFYPTILPFDDRDFSQPLQLLASSIAFCDPITQQPMVFTTQSTLKLAQ